ncbi:MAG: SUMF1/EgtB/PvdO family nonheme iron enzyme [Planctomycetes bacterium]|nr:SUMF1/EgtB/PvdO family nonheme iron enzyme [Planctomycetota bacterium]
MTRKRPDGTLRPPEPRASPVSEYRLTVLPTTDPTRFAVELRELVDDGMRRTWCIVAPPAGDGRSARPELAVDPAALACIGAVRRDPATLLPGRRDRLARLRRWRPRAKTEPSEAFHALCDALGSALLPAHVRDRLSAEVRNDGRLRLVVQAQGDATALPWERLRFAGDELAARRQWEIVRQLPDAPDATPGSCALPTAAELRRGVAPRRALLLIGASTQRRGGRRSRPAHADASIVAVHDALVAGGFEVEVCAGRPDGARGLRREGRDPLRIDHPLRAGRAAADLGRLLASGRFALLHYVGHGAADDVGPGGSEALLLEVADSPFPERVPLAALVGQIRAGGVRAALLHACDTREAATERLLRDGGVQHVVTMAGRVPPEVSAVWSRAFYGALGEHGRFAAAVAAARGALHDDAIGGALAWMPQHWSRDDFELAFADEPRMVVERYCAALAARLDAFEGRFFDRFPAGGLADIYVEEHIDERADDDDQRPRLQLPPGCSFAQLVEYELPPERRRFLLGGGPGAGKSTALRMQARRLAMDPGRTRVPLYAPLAVWLGPGGSAAGAPSLAEHAAHTECPPDEREALAGELDRLGRDGRLLVLLDGLDELDDQARTELQQRRLPELLERWRGSTLVVTTRRYRFTGRLKGCADVDIRPLDPPRAHRLLRNVLIAGGSDGSRAEEIARHWVARFQHGVRGWRELGRVPLFVTLLGELLLRGREPGDSRAAFFEEVFAHLCLDQHHGPALDVELGDAGPRPLVTRSPDDATSRARVAAVLDVLAVVARRMTDATCIDARFGDLQRWLDEHSDRVIERLAAAGLPADPTAFLRAAAQRTAILGPHASADPTRVHEPDTLWRFWHRSFQEILTARSLAHELDSGAVPRELLQPERIRLEPDQDEIRRTRQALLDSYRADNDWAAFWPDRDEALLHANKKQTLAIMIYALPSRGVYEPGVREEVAYQQGPRVARRNRRTFWVEPLAALLGLGHAGRARVWRRQLGRELLRIDPELGREAIAAADAPPPRLVERALQSTSKTDDDVARASSGTELHESMTLRLAERAPIYLAQRRVGVDADERLRMLGRRIRAADEPGELFLIDEVLRTLPRSKASAALRRRLRQRCGTPVPGSWAAYFVRIPGGRCTLGSEAGQLRERPSHPVELSPYWLGETPITVALYRQFWPTHRMHFAEHMYELSQWTGSIDDEPVDRLPATYVSWFAAQMLCRWLRAHWRMIATERPELLGWRPVLPTEAQAEFAIRAGSYDHSEWWFGDEKLADRFAWYRGNSQGRVHAVGLKGRNALGLTDMVGNVGWWCRDAYEVRAYEARMSTGRLNDPFTSGPYASPRVIRGGSCDAPVVDLRSADRAGYQPASVSKYRGVRLALVPASSSLGAGIDDPG